jgi:predicted methyltransferase
LLRLTDLTHDLIRGALAPGDWAVDATVGNGHDTARLAAAVGPQGRVFGFDIQASALEAARARHAFDKRVTLIEASHADMRAHLPPEAAGRIAAVMFNLGYRPGGDHALTTHAESTLEATAVALHLLRAGGRLSVIAYRGHPAGAREADALLAEATRLGAMLAVTHIRRLAMPQAPELFVFDKPA